MRALVLMVCSTLALAAPPIPNAPKWAPPAAQVRTLASGARLWVLPQRGVPLVHVGVLVTAGSTDDLPTLPGLASLTASAVEEGGSGTRSAAEVRAFFDRLGTALHVDVGPDATTLRFTSLSANLEPALGQLVEVLSSPRFDAPEVAALKQRRRNEVLTELDDPRVLGGAKLLAELYGANPRNHLPMGTPAGLDTTSAEDVKAFYSAHWASAHTLFVLVGDVDPDAARALLNKLAPKPWLTPNKRPVFPMPAGAPGKWVAFDKPGAAQTVVAMGRPGPGAAAAACTALELAATVLGGSFTSRLVQNLREKNGYTYGASSWLDGGRETRALMIRTSVRTEVTAPALQELLKEMKGLTKLDPGDLEKARALQDGAQLEAFASGMTSGEALLNEAALGKGPDALAVDRLRREKATLTELTAAAASFDPSGFTMVLVGDRAKLEKQLEASFPGQEIEWRK